MKKFSLTRATLTHATLPLTLILALSACGSQQGGAPATDTGGASAQRVPDLELTLPDAQDMAYPGVKASGLRTQATTPSASAWTGPRTFSGVSLNQDLSVQPGVDEAGDVYLNTTSGRSSSYTSTIYGYGATGDSLGMSTALSTYLFTGMAVGDYRPASANTLITSVFHIGSSSQQRPLPISLFSPWFTDETHSPNRSSQVEVPNGIHRDASGFYDMEANGNTADGISFLDNTPTSQRSVNVYTADKPSLASDTYLSSITPVLYPKNLTGYDPDRVQMKFSGNYQGAYVVMAFPQTGCTTAACPSLYNVQYILDHKVQWSRVWKSAKPVKFRFASANSSTLVLLTTDGSTNPDSADGQTTLTWVRNDGVVTLRARVPLELWRRDWARSSSGDQYSIIPNMTFVRVDDAGKLLLNSGNALLSGTFDEGLSNIFVVDQQNANADTNRGYIAGSAVFNGDYVYAAGGTRTNYGALTAPEGLNRYLILPLNFGLQDRTASQ